MCVCVCVCVCVVGVRAEVSGEHQPGKLEQSHLTSGLSVRAFCHQMVQRGLCPDTELVLLFKAYLGTFILTLFIQSLNSEGEFLTPSLLEMV